MQIGNEVAEETQCLPLRRQISGLSLTLIGRERKQPGIKLTIGPPISAGFYYDVDFGDHPFDASHLAKLEEKIAALARAKQPFIRRVVSKEEALSFFRKRGNNYKVALIEPLEEGNITFYEQGNLIDLCHIVALLRRLSS